MGLDMMLYAGEREEPVAYWRKANAIHGWFVRNVQGGVDECQQSRVTRDQLSDLRNLAAQVLEQPERGPKLLPTESGFFFGPTAYDEWYLDSLKETVDQLDACLTTYRGNFLYQSSW